MYFDTNYVHNVLSRFNKKLPAGCLLSTRREGYLCYCNEMSWMVKELGHRGTSYHMNKECNKKKYSVPCVS